MFVVVFRSSFPPDLDPLVQSILVGQIDRLKDAYPVLRHMTGEAFEKDHWRILFGIMLWPKELK